jgi:hypothetical protein
VAFNKNSSVWEFIRIGQQQFPLPAFAVEEDKGSRSVSCVLYELAGCAHKHGRAISGRKWAGLITSSKGGVVCALA